MSDNITKRVGLGTAYGFAKAGGYEGTVAEFTELLGNIAIDLARIENLSVTVTTLPAGSQATASLNGSVLSLGIPKGDKGDKGNTGETGAPAGFGTVSATVDDNIGTPSVEVTASGADAAKNFAFAFHNLKGQKGDKGDTGDVSQAQLDAAVSDLKSDLGVIAIGGESRMPITPTVIDGSALIGEDGTLTTTSAYNYTDYIEIPNDATKVKLTATYNGDFGMAFYNSQKTFVSGVYGRNVADYGGSSEDTTVPQTLTLNIPSTAKYIRATMRTSYYTQPSDYGIIFFIPKESVYDLMDALGDSLDSDIKNIADVHYSKNLINESLAVTGAIQANGNISTAGSFANYLTSDFVPVEKDKTYSLGVYNQYGQYYSTFRKIYLLYDLDKNIVSGTYTNVTTDVTFTPAQDGYIRASWANESRCMLELGTTHSEYVPYSADFLLNDILPLTSAMRNEVSNTAGNSLYGKKWAHCGDSFSHYTNKNFDSGIFASKNKTFPRIIAEKNGMNLLEDFMLSGRTLAYPSDGTFTNALTAPNQSYNYQNIPNDTDYITIMLGINDCQHIGSGSTSDGEDATGVITLGTIDDNTTATYYGAWNVVLGWLRENRPFAHIGIVITNGTTRQDYTEAQIAVAKKWGYPYINLNGDDRTPAFIRCYNPNIPNSLKNTLMQIQGVDNPSNTHPNWQTHELESTIIESWLRSL